MEAVTLFNKANINMNTFSSVFCGMLRICNIKLGGRGHGRKQIMSACYLISSYPVILGS